MYYDEERETIIHYDKKYVWNKMVRTCRKKYLEYLGPYQLIILQKAMPTIDREFESVPMFYVETEDHQYQGMLMVNLIEYRKYKVGQCFMGGVILYTKKEGCYYMSKYDDPKRAIKRMSRYAKVQMIGLVIVVLLFIETVYHMLVPLFR